MRTPMSFIEKVAGVFILLALAALLALILFPGMVTGRFLKVHEVLLRAEDGVNLAAGDKVVLQGVQVGEVTGLKFDDAGKVLIAIKVYPAYVKKIRAGMEAVLVPPPVMGSSVVRLSLGEGEPLPTGAVLAARVQSSPLDRMGEIANRVEEFMGVIPALKEDLAASSASVRASLVHVERGLESFPELMSRSNDALAESRRIIESLQRNFLIRANLPREEEPAGMVPASFRGAPPPAAGTADKESPDVASSE